MHARSRRTLARARARARALTAEQPHRLRLQAPPVLVTNWRKAATPFSDSYSLEGWAGAPLPADLSDSSAQRDVSVAIDEHVEIVFVAQVALRNSPRPLCPPLCACIQPCASGAPSRPLPAEPARECTSGARVCCRRECMPRVCALCVLISCVGERHAVLSAASMCWRAGDTANA